MTRLEVIEHLNSSYTKVEFSYIENKMTNYILDFKKDFNCKELKYDTTCVFFMDRFCKKNYTHITLGISKDNKQYWRLNNRRISKDNLIKWFKNCDKFVL